VCCKYRDNNQRKKSHRKGVWGLRRHQWGERNRRGDLREMFQEPRKEKEGNSRASYRRKGCRGYGGKYAYIYRKK